MCKRDHDCREYPLRVADPALRPRPAAETDTEAVAQWLAYLRFGVA
jgi:hypothetical protein